MTSHGGGGPRRQEAERWLGVAGKLLEARDFEGCKQFVDQSVSADPHVPGAEELVAAAEVLQSVQLRLINGHPDYYAVLGLDSSLPSSLDPAAVALHYQRLSLLLVRDPPTPAFTDAAKLVSDAWNVLADPASKALFDKELELARPKLKPRSPSPPPPPLPPPVSSSPRKTPVKVKPAKLPRVSKTPKSAPVRGESSSVKSGKSVAKPTYFWTMCTTCCHVHQYGRLCEGQYLLCHSCRRPFFAAAMNEPPPIVPDTDMYYCTWGFFPLGFPGGPGYGGMYGLGSQLGTASLPAAQPAVVPAKMIGERVNGSGTGIGSGSSFTPGKRGRGRPRKNPPVTGTPTTPGSSLVKVPSTQPSVVSAKLGQKNVNVTRTPNTFPGKQGRGRGRGRGRPPGRPRKNPPSSGMHAMPIINTQTSVILLKKGGDSVNGTGTGNGMPNTFPAKRGPGRPRKNYPSPAAFRTPESGLVDVPVVASESAAVMSSISWGSTEGTVPGTAEGNVPGTTEGTVPGPVEGTVPGTVPGSTEGAVDSPSSQPVKRGRGRPRKNEADSASYTQKMVAKKRVNATMETVVVDMN